MTRKRKLLISIACIAAILSFVIPTFASAQASKDISGFYMGSVSQVRDINGVRYNLPYNYLGIELDQEDEIVTGYLYGFNASSVNGACVRGAYAGATATIQSSYSYRSGWTWITKRNYQRLVWGDNNVTALTTGTLWVYLPSGCDGMAWNATGVVEGSPVDLDAGWNSITITGTGIITVGAYMLFDTLATVTGASGAYSFFLGGTGLATNFTANTATVTGVSTWTRVFAPGDQFDITGDGTVEIWMPIGTTGSVSGEGITVDGQASEDLTTWYNDIVIAGSPGTLTVQVQTNRAFSYAGTYGRTRNNIFSSYYWCLNGRLVGFLLTDTDPWNAYLLNWNLKARKLTYNPIID